VTTGFGAPALALLMINVGYRPPPVPPPPPLRRVRLRMSYLLPLLLRLDYSTPKARGRTDATHPRRGASPSSRAVACCPASTVTGRIVIGHTYMGCIVSGFRGTGRMGLIGHAEPAHLTRRPSLR
jgi:hypothetical protein